MKMQQLKFAIAIKLKMAKIINCLKLHANCELELIISKSILIKFINFGNYTELSQGSGFFSLFANVLWLGVCYFALQILQALAGKLNFLGYFKTESEASNAYQNELLKISTKPLLYAGGGVLNEN